MRGPDYPVTPLSFVDCNCNPKPGHSFPSFGPCPISESTTSLHIVIPRLLLVSDSPQTRRFPLPPKKKEKKKGPASGSSGTVFRGVSPAHFLHSLLLVFLLGDKPLVCLGLSTLRWLSSKSTSAVWLPSFPFPTFSPFLCVLCVLQIVMFRRSRCCPSVLLRPICFYFCRRHAGR